jgi:hypothetical protein
MKAPPMSKSVGLHDLSNWRTNISAAYSCFKVLFRFK